MPPRALPKKDKASVVLPRSAGATTQAAAEPEEPDEDDDYE